MTHPTIYFINKKGDLYIVIFIYNYFHFSEVISFLILFEFSQFTENGQFTEFEFEFEIESAILEEEVELDLYK